MFYKICTLVITICVVLSTLVVFTFVPQSEEGDSYFADCYEPNSIAILPFYGEIVWGVSDSGAPIYGANVEIMLRELVEIGDFAGLVIDLDSPGGNLVASYRLAEIVRELNIPTATAVSDMAMSGGYAVAAATDRIYIHPISNVGSIGVTASFVNEALANEAGGYVYESLSTGDFKDMGDPGKIMTEEERAFIMENLEGAHEYFVAQVAADRGMTNDQVSSLADGRWYSNMQAIELGLADDFGGVDEAVAYIRSQTNEENPICYLPVF